MAADVDILAIDNLAGDMNRMGKLFAGFTTLVTFDDTDICASVPDAKSDESILRCQKKHLRFKMRRISAKHT